MAGAREEAARRGYRVATIGKATVGEARETATRWLDQALAVIGQASGAVCVIGSGEPTVTVRGSGLGGRTQEFALAAAHRLAAADLAPDRVVVLASAGTDGVDGPTDAAGAVVDRASLARARASGLDPAASLADNDAYRLFERLGDLIRWGPTGTNVGDLHVLVMR